MRLVPRDHHLEQFIHDRRRTMDKGRRRLRCFARAVLSVLLIALYAPPVLAYLMDTASHPPPTSGTYSYNGFKPNHAAFPARGGTYTDPVFGSAIRRLTNEFNPGPTGSGSHIYAKNGFWNADGTRFLHWTNTNGNTVIINTTTGAVVRDSTTIPSEVSSDSSFAPDDPNVLYYVSGSTLRRYLLDTGTSQAVRTFGGTLGDLGGSVDWIDRSGRYMLLNIGGNLTVWDRISNVLYSGVIAASRVGDGGWAGISPDGSYVVLAGDDNLHESYAITHASRVVSSTGVNFWTLCGDHGDLVSASNGKTYFVTFACNNYPGIYAVDVSVTAGSEAQQLANPAHRKLVDTQWQSDPGAFNDNNGHFSGVSSGSLKDWVFVSTESGPDDFDSSGAAANWRPYKQEILAANVLTGEVRRLAHHRSRDVYDGPYRYQPRVSASWNGLKVAWASNFNYEFITSDSAYVDLYSIDNPLGGGGGDTIAPTASMTSPANGATVSGIITVSAQASDNVGVAGVQFRRNSTDLGAEDTTAPYSITWDTKTVPNGSYTLGAIARDAAGLTGSATPVSITVDNPPPSSLVVDNVVWTSKVNVTSTGNSLQKTGGCDSCEDAGAISQERIFTPNGYMEFTAAATDKRLYAGLSNGNPGVTVAEIDFALALYTGYAEVRESEVYRADITYTAGDVFRIAVEAGVVKYYKNGQVFHTSTSTPAAYPLLVDTALLSSGATVSNARIAREPSLQNVSWKSLVNVTATGNSIQKTAGCEGCEDAGGVSLSKIASGDGYVEVTATELAGLRYAGIGAGGSGTTAAGIAFGLAFFSGYAEVRESDVYRADTTYTVGDVFRVGVENGLVKYYKNGTTFYTSGIAPTYPLFLDTSLLNLNSKVSNAVIFGVR
jgi:Big-like domain-containing protein